MNNTGRIQSEIIGGIEWYTVDAGVDEHDPTTDCQCARCGSSCSFLDCWECGGSGVIEHDEPEDFQDDARLIRCPTCRGTAGSWHCISDPEWCNANPMPSRAIIKSTALKSEAWND